MTKAATPLRVITSGAFAAALKALLPGYSPPPGYRVELAFGSSLGAAHDSIPTRLAQGERFDLYLLAEAAFEKFAADGWIEPGSRADLVASEIGACVRNEDPAPDIGTLDGFIAALRAAPRIGHAASASGIYLSTEVFPKLGLAEEMAGKAFTVYSERVGTIVARGDAHLGFQQVSEILPIEGVKLIGTLPPEIRRRFLFCAGLGAGSPHREAALHLLRYLASDAAAATIRKTGLIPLHPEV
ncbi:molybdate ABC transporter substrate-binding protein [Alkalilacustris brevis]|uniref:molybdate ABC transporter substrate-binding protein n=1 Tax=Alkalilacustris brevis TaxID=2026338 RepID=UPI00138FE5C8|nr:substrate-binding domain-containing protein [Alkalilacustris brevis]